MTHFPSRSRPFRLALGLTSLALAASLSGCASAPKATAKPDPAAVPNPTAALPLDRHPAQLVSAPEEIRLRAREAGLSEAQRDAVDRLVIRYRASGAPFLVISHPDRPGFDARLRPLQAYLAERGVNPGEVTLFRQTMTGQPDPQGDVITLGYGHERAVLPNCQKYAAINQGGRFDNQVSAGFGCAASANLAAMVEQPSDLKRPRGLDPADQGRRDTINDKFRKGEKTGSEKDKDSDAGIAKRGQ